MFSKQIIGQGATIRPIIRGRESQIQHLKKKTDKNLLIQFELFTFFKHARLQKNLSRTSAIHPGIFPGGALWADSVSLRMITIVSRDQFKKIRIGENLMMNCNL